MSNTNLKDIIKFYLEIINENVGHFKINDYENFLKSSIKFGNNGILLEDKNLLIDVPNETIQYILSNDNKYLNVNEFKETFKNSKHWRNIKNINFGEIYFGIFDFNNDLSIDEFNVKCFNVSNDDLKINKNIFIEYCSKICGFYNSLNENKHVICVNSKSNNVVQTLYHELSHFIQNIGKIRIISKTLSDKHKEKIVKDISNEEISNKVISYFSGSEFIPHLDDLIIDLKKVNNTIYKNDVNFFDIFISFLNDCKNKSYDEIIKEDFYLNYLKINKDSSPLIMLIYAFKIKFKSQRIFNILSNSLTKLK